MGEIRKLLKKRSTWIVIVVVAGMLGYQVNMERVDDAVETVDRVGEIADMIDGSGEGTGSSFEENE